MKQVFNWWWNMFNNLIYVQWYPYKKRSGFCIINPSEDALEKFYENVRASDPRHVSFVLTLSIDVNSLNMKTIDEYIRYDVLPILFENRR